MLQIVCRRVAVLAVVAAGFVIGSTQAHADTMTFRLYSHPDGNQAPPSYGLRLDGLTDGDSDREWLFDFSHADSAMYLVYDDGGSAADLTDDSIRIHGVTFGGEQALDNGDGYVAGSTGLWDVDFTYREQFQTGLDVVTVDEDPLNNGTISAQYGLGVGVATTYDLTDVAGSHPSSFYFNNTEDHRLGGTPLAGQGWYVGWGWLNHSGAPGHVYSSDWLFVGEPVPEPATLALLGSGLVALGAARRRRRPRAITSEQLTGASSPAGPGGGSCASPSPWA